MNSSFKKTVFRILPELNLRIGFPAEHFVNANIPAKEKKALLSEKELIELPGDSPNIFYK